MKHIPKRLFIPLLVTLFTAFLVGNASSVFPSVSAASERCVWHKVLSPSIGGGLWGVSAASHTDVWAVGSNGGSDITEHWNGKNWIWIPSPQPGNYTNYALSVAALSSSNVWAVGAYQSYKGPHAEPGKTLIEHWDGARWKLVKSPNVGTFLNELHGVTAIASDDIWAVGYSENSNPYAQKALIEHWNGTQWSVVPSPNPGTYSNLLEAVIAFSSNDIWAVGDYTSVKGQLLTMIEHWNGKQWRVVPSPNVHSYDTLASVAGAAPNDIWTVGDSLFNGGETTLIEHWNGKQWRVVAGPNPSGGDNFLQGVAALASKNVWAVGSSLSGPLIIQWDGRQWNTRPSDSKQYWSLTRVATLNAHDIWGVGAADQMLIMHYC